MKLLMVDYYGMSDSEGKVLGHSYKVLREYSEMLRNCVDLSLAASPCIISEWNQRKREQRCDTRTFTKVYALPYDIQGTGTNSLRKRLSDKVKLFHNLDVVFQLPDQFDAIWFYRTDFFLFLYIYLHWKKAEYYKMVGLVYHQSFTGGRLENVLQRIYRKALQRLDLVIVTGKEENLMHRNVFRMPDYTYDSTEYTIPSVKKERAVCVGTMNPYKELEELVESFNRNGYPLYIAGRFTDPERAICLRTKASKNIVIVDRVLSAEEYRDCLSSAKYAVLPYCMHQYENRTSGILQECAFWATIPVAPSKLLRENNIPGIGYDSWEEMESFPIDVSHNEKIYEEMKRYRRRSDRKAVSLGLQKAIHGIMDLT